MVANRTRKLKERKVIADFSTEDYPQKHCWEMANEVGDFRSEFNICEDCIIFLLEQDSTLLSKKKKFSIKHREVSCKFFNV